MGLLLLFFLRSRSLLCIWQSVSTFTHLRCVCVCCVPVPKQSATYMFPKMVQYTTYTIHTLSAILDCLDWFFLSAVFGCCSNSIRYDSIQLFVVQIKHILYRFNYYVCVCLWAYDRALGQIEMNFQVMFTIFSLLAAAAAAVVYVPPSH